MNFTAVRFIYGILTGKECATCM
ncbi:hypothetical protein ZEAMMB73_Zm00001d039261 [Zea mays]|uniref:Uncharacterized protein n=1 Tax=Zea mays TaxID=4577 RepID=A0A1D6MES5_MAIZE|nr:hypothetical protein ZEAMMB73_Zm00001d039261 [Zea mays]